LFEGSFKKNKITPPSRPGPGTLCSIWEREKENGKEKRKRGGETVVHQDCRKKRKRRSQRKKGRVSKDKREEKAEIPLQKERRKGEDHGAAISLSTTDRDCCNRKKRETPGGWRGEGRHLKKEGGGRRHRPRKKLKAFATAEGGKKRVNKPKPRSLPISPKAGEGGEKGRASWSEKGIAAYGKKHCKIIQNCELGEKRNAAEREKRTR